MAVNRQQLIKLRQNFSSTIETDFPSNLNYSPGFVPRDHFKYIELSDCVLDGRKIYYAQLIKSELLKFCFSNSINMDFVFDDDQLLKESENFYEFLQLASKDQIKKPGFYSKALRIFPLCIIPYAQHLPKKLDPDLIEEIIDRFPVLYSFIDSNFEIPHQITEKLIKNSNYFYDGKLLKLMIEQKPRQIEKDLENFLRYKHTNDLVGGGQGIAGHFVEEFNIKITSDNFCLFDWSKCRGNELHQITKHGFADDFLDHIGEHYLESYGEYCGLTALGNEIDCEFLENLVDIIKHSNKSSIDKHKMFISLLMVLEYVIFNDVFTEHYWKIEFYGYKKNIVEFRGLINKTRLEYLKSTKLAQLYFNYPGLCKNFHSDILKNLNPFLRASYSKQRDRSYRYLYMVQKRAFTRMLKAHCEERHSGIMERICKKFLRKFQPNFYCKKLVGSAKKI